MERRLRWGRKGRSSLGRSLKSAKGTHAMGIILIRLASKTFVMIMGAFHLPVCPVAGYKQTALLDLTTFDYFLAYCIGASL
jgi:hypothetical protein